MRESAIGAASVPPWWTRAALVGAVALLTVAFIACQGGQGSGPDLEQAFLRLEDLPAGWEQMTEDELRDLDDDQDDPQFLCGAGESPGPAPDREAETGFHGPGERPLLTHAVDYYEDPEDLNEAITALNDAVQGCSSFVDSDGVDWMAVKLAPFPAFGDETHAYSLIADDGEAQVAVIMVVTRRGQIASVLTYANLANQFQSAGDVWGIAYQADARLAALLGQEPSQQQFAPTPSGGGPSAGAGGTGTSQPPEVPLGRSHVVEGWEITVQGLEVVDGAARGYDFKVYGIFQVRACNRGATSAIDPFDFDAVTADHRNWPANALFAILPAEALPQTLPPAGECLSGKVGAQVDTDSPIRYIVYEAGGGAVDNGPGQVRWTVDPSGQGQTSSPPTCTQLVPGCEALVVNVAPEDLFLREAPSRAAAVTGRLPELLVVCIVGGPASADGRQWWQVRTPAGAQGWAASGDGATPWLQPTTAPC